MIAPPDPQSADRRARLAAVRAQMRRAFGPAADGLPLRGVPTGMAPLDALLVAGGLPRGRLTALVGAGATALLHQAVAETTRGGTVAWLDPTGRLDATALAAAGADLAEVLVSRPASEATTLRAAAVLQRTGASDLLIIDAPTITPRAVSRLATLARLGTTALVLLAPPVSWLAEATDLLLLVARTGWHQERMVLQGTTLTVTAVRQRGAPSGGTATVAIGFAHPLPRLPGLDRLVATGPARVVAMPETRHGAG
jgi:hypothetical protein